jgi:hypothetical protein
MVFSFFSLLQDFLHRQFLVPVSSLRFPRLSLPVVFGRAAGERLSNFCCCSVIHVRKVLAITNSEMIFKISSSMVVLLLSFPPSWTH